MRHFFEWVRQEREGDGRPWLILGKGPSFARRHAFDLDHYQLLSLNHAVREQPVLLAHMIDLDVVDACADVLSSHAAFVVLPWHPHVNNTPGRESLEEIVPGHALLRHLAGEGRLLWYDLSTAQRRHGPGPVVHATYFSAEAAVDLLALSGATCVRSLGVDGGATYSADFDDLARRTLLSNGHPGFDLQFQGIATTLLRSGMDFAPLDQPAPIEILVPSRPATALPAQVLEYSARKHTSMTLRVTLVPSDGASFGNSASNGDESLRRAIVLPPGALVLDDLRKLWTRPRTHPGIEVARETPVESGNARDVAVITAARPHDLKALAEPSAAVPMTVGLPAAWSRRDHLEPDDTSVLLFDDVRRAPWLSRAHPLAHLWVGMLIDGVRDGCIAMDFIRDEARRGHVRPSLAAQVEHRSPEALLLSRSLQRLDADFVPPDGSVPVDPGLIPSPLLLVRALARVARHRVSARRRGQS